MDTVFRYTTLADVERRTLTSAATASDHDIYISKPSGYHISDKYYPLLIVLDANYGFGTAVESSQRQGASGEALEMVVVGLGTPGGLKQHGARRMRDYTPGVGQLASGDAETEVGKLIQQRARREGSSNEYGLGGARQFSVFIRDELLTLLVNELRIDQADMGLLGYSAGGAFVLDLLLRGAAPFRKLIFGSFPCNCYGLEELKSLEAQFAAQVTLPRAYVSFGGAEFTDPELSRLMLASQALLERLKASAPNFDLTIKIFPEETHTSAFPMLTASGIRKFWPSGLNFSQALKALRSKEADAK